MPYAFDAMYIILVFLRFSFAHPFPKRDNHIIEPLHDITLTVTNPLLHKAHAPTLPIGGD